MTQTRFPAGKADRAVLSASASPDARGERSSALVLWFMLLVVFGPIALAHGVAVWTEPVQPGPAAVAR